jgi:hypothetical protein
MKTVNLIYTVLVAIFIGCQGKTSNASINGNDVRVDTLFVGCGNICIFITPTDSDIIRMRSKYLEDDFYVMADDAAYAMTETERQAKAEGFKIMNVDTTYRYVNLKDSFLIDLSDTTIITNPLSTVILYKRGRKPMVISTDDAVDSLKTVQELGLTKADNSPCQSIKDRKWIGIYKADIGCNQKDRDDFTVTLTISPDSIVFEAAGHTLYNQYLLYVAKEDTMSMKLAYCKTIDENSSAFALKQTTDFGTIEYSNGQYFWHSAKYVAILAEDEGEYKLRKQ